MLNLDIKSGFTIKKLSESPTTIQYQVSHAKSKQQSQNSRYFGSVHGAGVGSRGDVLMSQDSPCEEVPLKHKDQNSGNNIIGVQVRIQKTIAT